MTVPPPFAEQNDVLLSNPFGLELIVCDNDGCLLPEEPELIDHRTLAPIAAYNCLAFGQQALKLPPLTICTGRPGPFVELLLRVVGCQTLPAVCEHGVLTYALAENVAHRDPAITAEHLLMIGELRRWLRSTHPDWILEAGKEATVSTYVPAGGSAVDERMGVIAQKVVAEGWPMVVARSVTYVNVTLNHITKATALTRMFADLGVDASKVLAIGDTAGDLSMAKICGYFACPANAVDEVKKKADYISPVPITAGVVDILNHYTGFDPRVHSSVSLASHAE